MGKNPSSSVRGGQQVSHIDIASKLIRHILYPLWEKKNNSSRLRYLTQLEASQFLPEQKLQENQFKHFRELIAYAYDNCPYYARKYKNAGMHPDDIQSNADISKVPVITKEEIQENREELISKQYGRSDLISDMTGGSTGSPLQFYYDQDRLDSRSAATIRHNRWAGWDIGDRAAILWGAPRDTKTSGRMRDRIRSWILERRIMLDASSIDDAAMYRFAQSLIEYRPKVLLAYANTLALFARYLDEERIRIPAPAGIISSAEVLTDENRKLVERVFQSPVYDRYGSREFSVIASECNRHEGLHINAENLLVEVLKDGVPCTGEDGEIVITDLSNLAMPMIRYRTKDIGCRKAEACSCTRGLPLLKLSGGRESEFLFSTNGKYVSGIVIATYVITNIRGIRQVQFVQEELGTIKIHLVKGPEWSSQSENMLRSKAREFLGADILTTIIYQENIPHSVSGKYQFSICKVSMNTI